MLYPDRDLVPDRKKGPGWKKVVVFILIGVLIGKIGSSAVQRWILFPMRVASSDMAPAIPSGTTLLIYRLVSPEGLTHGDIALFRHPESPSLYMLRRIVALPGETIEIRGGIPFRDGTPVAEITVEPSGDGASLIPDAAPIRIGAEQFYVMADRQSTGVDSKGFGPVPFESLVGKGLK
jgi:signal peptidase I